jgi:hypothetical protein
MIICIFNVLYFNFGDVDDSEFLDNKGPFERIFHIRGI